MVSDDISNDDPTGAEPGRECGDCTLCCKLMGVPELKKASARWCEHCLRGDDAGHGCGVYDERPPSCRNFQCFWLMDANFPDEFRPDRIGALAAFNDGPDSAVLHVDPARRNVLSRPEVRAMMEALGKVYPRVFVVNGKESALIQN